MKPANPEHNQKVSEKRSEFHKWVLQMVILLSEIHKTPGMIEDAILARDKDEYVNASELRKQRLADKAAKRTGCMGWSIGKQQQERLILTRVIHTGLNHSYVTKPVAHDSQRERSY